ncbi:hypothetical protein CK203_009136 [Vitis vinifera]|uniref:Uncharacterized protein n=1 Tax=Vitis vinifera TaxID=29760 RepID=A0A438K353_VITVI|nr:hypothetical protein CK203_009136 [Vitis vinifera]
MKSWRHSETKWRTEIWFYNCRYVQGATMNGENLKGGWTEQKRSISIPSQSHLESQGAMKSVFLLIHIETCHWIQVSAYRAFGDY